MTIGSRFMKADRDAAIEAANEACRNMDGELDIDALAEHFARWRRTFTTSPVHPSVDRDVA